MIIDRFDAGAARSPERNFVRGATGSYTYGETARASHAIAHALQKLGLAGGHVGLLAPNDPMALLAILGIVRAGATYVPLAGTDADAALSGFMMTADVEVLICHSAFATRLPELRKLSPNLRLVIGLDKVVEPNGAVVSEWMKIHDGKIVNTRKLPDDVAIIKASGGTTGKPKAIMQTHRALDAAYRIVNQFSAPKGDNPVHLILAPLTHAAGATTLALAEFGTSNVLASGRDPAAILAEMEAERVSHIFLPPTVIYRLLAHADAATRDLSALETIVYGAAPMSVDKLREGLRLWGPVFVQNYGQSEAPGVVSVLSHRDHLIPDGADESPLRSAGRPTGACEVVLMDDEGHIVPQGARGEIVLRGELVTPGYYNNPQANAEAHAFGWHHTGDIGQFDRDGFLHIVDRKKDMIISGGFNVYPSEIEQVIWGHPAVQECAVVGVPDEDWGEIVTAVIELKADVTASNDDIITLCKERLGSVKSPKKVVFWEELPRSAVGKVLKKDIRSKLNGSEI
jgi:acyl-CoA synthetase (AMP-forming)/AMP-acid ligase II